MARLPLPLSPTTLAALDRHLGAVVGPIELLPSLDAVAAESHGEQWRNPAREGLWIVGMATNGDAWAVDTRDGDRVAVLSHDLIQEGEVDRVREGAIAVAESLADALIQAEAGGLPYDYWEALERSSPEAEPPSGSLLAGIPSLEERLADTTKGPDEAAILSTFFGAGTSVAWEHLEDALAQLEPIERNILNRRYGLQGGAALSVEETANVLRLTVAEVKDDEARGLRWLRRLVSRPKPN